MPVIESGRYVPPNTRAIYVGNDVSLTNGGQGALGFDTKHSGSSLLDITTPTAPTIITAGIYAVTVEGVISTLTVGGFFGLTLEMDEAGDDATIDYASPAGTAADNFFFGTLSMTYYCPAGAVIIVTASNNDGAVSRNFHISQAVIQRIT